MLVKILQSALLVSINVFSTINLLSIGELSLTRLSSSFIRLFTVVISSVTTVLIPFSFGFSIFVTLVVDVLDALRIISDGFFMAVALFVTVVVDAVVFVTVVRLPGAYGKTV